MFKNRNIIKTFSFLLVLAAVLFYYQAGTAQADQAQPVLKQEKKSPVPVVEKETIAVSQVASAILTRMHYMKKPMTKETSIEFFNAYLKKIDPLHMFFTKEKIKEWEPYAPVILSKILDGDPGFAYIVYAHYLAQLAAYKDYVKNFSVTDSDLLKDEFIEIDRTKVDWPENEAKIREVWRKKLTNDVILLKILDRIEKEKAATEPKKTATKWKKVSPLEQVRKRALLFITQEESASSMTVIENYLNALAGLYDPHTEYMAPETEEDFNINMSLSLCGIGAVLSPADDGSTKIVKIIPGGPAMKNGQLHAEDRIIAVAQGNQEPVDVIDMPLHKVVQLIRGPIGTEVVITALDSKDGAGGTPKTVRLIREEV